MPYTLRNALDKESEVVASSKNFPVSRNCSSPILKDIKSYALLIKVGLFFYHILVTGSDKIDKVQIIYPTVESKTVS